MSLRSWLVLAGRELRGSAGRMAFFAACLAVGVAAVVAVAGLAAALDDGIQAQARQLLAADLAVASRRPIPEPVLAAVDGLPGARRAELRELPSVVSVPAAAGSPPGASLLVEIKAVAPGYPFYGALTTEPTAPLADLLGENQVLVGPELLQRLGLAVGSRLRVGSADFVIAGTVLSEPDRLEVGFAFGPRVLMSLAALERTGLVGLGSRVGYRVLVRLEDGTAAAAVERAAAAVRAAVADPAFVEVETYLEAQPSLRRGLGRVEQFLGLVALLSLLVGGIGVAQAVRAWLAGRLDAIAVLRALGVRPREVLALYLGQAAILAAVGSGLGALAGALAAQAVPRLLAGLLPVAVTVGWQPAAMLRGIGLGIVVALLFAARPLVDVMRVPPLRVLRRDAEPLPAGRALAAVLLGVLVAGVAAIAALQSGSLLRGLAFAGGLAAATAVLAAGAWLTVRAVARAPRDRGGVALRHGLAALARPGAGTLGAVVALGIGVLTVLGMLLVQQRLAAQLDSELPAAAPTVFLIDIQPEQWPGVRAVLEEAGAEALESVEVVGARLAAINGVPVAELAAARDGDGRDRRWVLTREQRLTSMATLPADNVIVEGALWSDPERPELSIELEFARDLGARLGDTLSFDVQGVPLELVVSSLRTVEWERFSINFFLVVEPGVLERAPRHRIAAARLPAAAEPAVQDRLAAAYPNVTLLRLREILTKIVAVISRLGFAVRLLGAFTVLAGVAILAGAVSASALRRGREAALLKALGMTRAQVAAAFAVEYALVGLVAGLLGALGGVAMAWLVTRVGFEMPWAWSPGAPAAAVVLTVVLSVAAGLAASARALAVRPLAVLRQSG
ncbi:MAG: FtsX-like permease family protein [Thermoanaerobaculales bacterium]|nr:FtsX-like permease family protein [Thermoanaerobaculales bacterium]